MTARVVAVARFEPPPTKGSRFVATAIPVADADDARRQLAAVEAQMPDASHHCWAWRLAEGGRQQSSDAGEPGGSAGRPILAQITGHDLVDVLVVVTRYFGGTKLGVGGLVRAYGGAAGQVLDRVLTVPWIERVAVMLLHAYDDGAAIDGVVRRHDVEVVDVAWGAGVRRRLRVPVATREAFAADVRDATAGRVQVDDDPE